MPTFKVNYKKTFKVNYKKKNTCSLSKFVVLLMTIFKVNY